MEVFFQSPDSVEFLINKGNIMGAHFRLRKLFPLDFTCYAAPTAPLKYINT